MRTLIFDYESTELHGNVGVLLSAHFLEWDQAGKNKPYHFAQNVGVLKRLANPTFMVDDRALAMKIRDEMERYDLWIGFNSKEHDVRFLNSRLLFWGERVLTPRPHVDLLYIGKYHMKNRGNSLAKMAEHLGVEDKKTPLDLQLWKRAALGSVPDFRAVVEHGDADVIVTRGVYDALRRQHVINNIHR